ncbi:MAG: hypothetical protein ACI8W7_001163, partial [Gammaproteobacteria bacterium]
MKLHVNVQRATEDPDVPDDAVMQLWAHAAAEQVLAGDAQLS